MLQLNDIYQFRYSPLSLFNYKCFKDAGYISLYWSKINKNFLEYWLLTDWSNVLVFTTTNMIRNRLNKLSTDECNFQSEISHVIIRYSSRSFETTQWEFCIWQKDKETKVLQKKKIYCKHNSINCKCLYVWVT
jgi:hypothetical protein